MFSFLFHFFNEIPVRKQNSSRWNAALMGRRIDGTPHVAASHMALFWLPLSHKMDDRFIWFKLHEELHKLYYSKKVLHHQIFTKIYKYHFFLNTPNLNLKFDTASEDLIQYLTQQSICFET